MSKDTIYRQDFDKFLEDAEKEAVKNRKYVFASALNTIRGNLKIFPSAQPEQRWIKCSERLPEDGENVFVYMFNDSPYIAWINDGLWETDDFACEKEENPVAWMPLPEPYKERRTDEAD